VPVPVPVSIPSPSSAAVQAGQPPASPHSSPVSASPPRASRLLARMRRGWSFPPAPERGGSSSEAAKAFVTGLLQEDPQKRLSSEQVLSHPWIVGNTSVSVQLLRRPAPANGRPVGSSFMGGIDSSSLRAPHPIRPGELGACSPMRPKVPDSARLRRTNRARTASTGNDFERLLEGRQRLSGLPDGLDGTTDSLEGLERCADGHDSADNSDEMERGAEGRSTTEGGRIGSSVFERATMLSLDDSSPPSTDTERPADRRGARRRPEARAQASASLQDAGEGAGASDGEGHSDLAECGVHSFGPTFSVSGPSETFVPRARRKQRRHTVNTLLPMSDSEADDSSDNDSCKERPVSPGISVMRRLETSAEPVRPPSIRRPQRRGSAQW